MKRITLALLVISWASHALAADVLVPRALRVGERLRESIRGATEVRFSLEVPAHTATRVALHEDGIELDLRLLPAGTRGDGDPNGNPREQSADPAFAHLPIAVPLDYWQDSNGTSADELVAAPIRPTDERYEIEIGTIVRGTECGFYEIVVEQEPESDASRDIAEGHKLLSEAREVESAGGEKALLRALAMLEEGTERCERGGDPLGAAEGYYRAAMIDSQRSHYVEGTARLERAIALFHALGIVAGEGRAIDRLAEFARRVGDVEGAEAGFRRALPLVASVDDAEGQCDVRNNMGLLLEQTGRWDEALAMLQAAVPFSEKGGSLDVQSSLTHNIGQTYCDLGDYGHSLEWFGRSLEVKRRLKLPRRIARSLQAMAAVYVRQGDEAKAQATLEEALVLWDESGDRQGIGSARAALARMHVRRNDLDQAVIANTKALTMLREASDRRGEADALITKGEIELLRGDATTALTTLTGSLRISRDIADRMAEANSLYFSARALQKLSRLDEALAQANQAVDVVESMREAIISPELRSSYLVTVRRYFDLVIDLLIEKQQHAPSAGVARDLASEAFRANERSRARSLLESLAQSQADIHKGIAPDLLDHEQRVSRQLHAKQAYRAQLLRGGKKGSELAVTDAAVGALLAESHDIETQIRQTSPDYAALEFPEPVAMATLQSLLPADSLLLEYHLGETRSYVWSVSRNDVHVQLLASEKQLDTLVRRYHDLLRRDPTSLDAAAAAKLRRRVEAAGEALARAVFAPVAIAARDKRLLIVPDGALHYIPFGALPHGGQPLVVAHDITYLPAATLLATSRDGASAGSRERAASVAVFADPVFQRSDPRLERNGTASTNRKGEKDLVVGGAMRGADLQRLRFSRKEADAILSSADRHASLEALDFDASKQTLISHDLRRFRIIHIATHGVLDADEPDLSGLMLSRYDRRGKPVDGFLRLHDIYNLDLDADLVVLSACRSALGKAMYGEGLISLTRGFMYGGAKRVVATVWSVDDRATAQLMAHFYDAMLRRDAAPARALRNAQLAMLRDTHWRDPYFWAAFTLQGTGQ